MIDKNEAIKSALYLTQYASGVAAVVYGGDIRNAARLLREAVGTVACGMCEGTGGSPKKHPDAISAPCIACLGLGAVEPPAYTTSGQEVLYRGEHYCDARDNAAADFIALALNGAAE